MRLSSIALVLLAFAVCACASPETRRTRGSGPGADVGNKTEIVRMHEGARPYEKTPRLIPAEHPPLDAARQADRFSRA